MTIISNLNGLNIPKCFDMILILTSAEILLRPLLSTLLNTASLKLKRLRQKPKPEPICTRLPDELMTIILSKLDIVTLRRCAVSLSREDFLPQIESLYTSLPAELFYPDYSALWYGRLLNTILLKSPRLLGRYIESFPEFITKILFFMGTVSFLVVNTPELSEDSAWLLERLTGLRSLEVELPSLPCCDCRARPNLWFKWEAKFGVPGTVDHILFVIGDTIDNVEEDDNERAKKQLARGFRIAARHLFFHLSILLYFEKGGESLKTGFTMRTKDVGKNGGLEFVPRSWLSLRDGKLLAKCFYVPSTSTLSRSTDDGVQDVILMFFAKAMPEDEEFTDDDTVRLCLGNLDEDDGEANVTAELKRVVKQMLADGNCRQLPYDN